ncbi:MAG: hypothetical protein K2M87_04800 [Muribaculaceae bacterium]|nr:hypothetical protein [Muribaculaceae bacterium]
MTLRKYSATAARLLATVAVSVSIILLSSCEGRRMSNMQPTGETIEVNIPVQDDSSALTQQTSLPTDTI